MVVRRQGRRKREGQVGKYGRRLDEWDAMGLMGSVGSMCGQREGRVRGRKRAHRELEPGKWGEQQGKRSRGVRAGGGAGE